MDFNAWMKQKWYIVIILFLASNFVAALFVPRPFGGAAGIVLTLLVSYLIYNTQDNRI